MSRIELFITDDPTYHDLLISLPGADVDELYAGNMQIFNNSSPHSLPIPSSTLRVWIYDEDNEAITTIAAFQNSHVVRIYTLTNPCIKRVLCNEYGFDITTLPNIAPHRLCQDYHRFA
jgi:hypothetical protein